ncbi:MAG: hypothetical protein V7K48_15795 [Nostoc sp.]
MLQQSYTGAVNYQIEAMISPDQPPERATGTEKVRSLGGLCGNNDNNARI